MKKNEKKATKQIFDIIVFLCFFIALFFYIRLQINPRLYYQNQETIFFTDLSFFQSQLAQPGGFISYCAAFLSQFFIFPWVGALMITLLLFLTALLTRRLLVSAGGPAIPLLFLLPVVFLLMLHNNYQHPLSYTLGLVLALFFSNLYVLFQNKTEITRCCWAVFLAVTLYLLTAGPFLLFTLLCMIFEFSHRNLLIPAILLVLALVMPWLAAGVLYLYPLKDAFVTLLPFTDPYKPGFAPSAAYLVFPVVLIFVMIYHRIAARPKNNIFNSFKKPALALLLQYAVILLLLAGAVFLSFDHFDKTMLQASDDMRQGKWYSMIHDVTSQRLSSTHLFHYFYRALSHTDRLPHDFFTYPYSENVKDLLFSSDIGFSTPWIYSDFFWDIGLLNESEHWAFEAMAIQGPTVWILKRLALINILQGEKYAALKFLTNLSHTLFSKKWAQNYQPCVNNPALIDRDPALSKIRANVSDKEFITINHTPYASLESLFKTNKNNKMVFEYLCMHDLLNVELESFISRMPYLGNYGYVTVPRVFQEGILVYMYAKKLEKFEIPGMAFNPNMFNRFQDFQRTIARYQDKQSARNEMAEKFGRTYWFYLLYHKPDQISSTPAPGAGGKQ